MRAQLNSQALDLSFQMDLKTQMAPTFDAQFCTVVSSAGQTLPEDLPSGTPQPLPSLDKGEGLASREGHPAIKTFASLSS